jgi:thiosulfate/3-mercaptopyruvate sulfurtransferase
MQVEQETFAVTDPVIEAQDLAGLGQIRLVDARDAALFEAWAPDGAVRVPAERWIAEAKAHGGFDDVAFWGGELAALGLGDSATVVVYDDGRMTDAARIWFILQHFGLRARLLNRGAAALEGAPLSIAPPCDGFVPRPASGIVGLIDRHVLKASLDQIQVFDARTLDEHAGRDLKNNKRGGRLPGAMLLPHGALLDGPSLRPPAELRNLLAGAGFRADTPVATHCDGGGRAALAAIAAARAGYGDVKVYYLSFADWAADESCPID